VLAWHVDYWDRLGWKDTVGLKRATERQRRYQRALDMKVIGTPFLHVDNRRVRGRDAKAVVEKGSRLAARVRIEATAIRTGDKVSVVAKLAKGEKDVLPQQTRVFAVLVRKTMTTKCTAGENAGKTLVEYFSVLAASKPVAFDNDFTCEFTAPKDATDLSVALLVEDREKMRTLECASFLVRG